MRKIILNIIEIVLILVIVLVCFISILQNTFLLNKEVFGYYGYVIESNNMNPILEKGDVILVKKTSFEDIKKGDIVTYYSEEKANKKIFTQEVIDIFKESDITTLKTKGTTNSTVENYVYEKQVYGVYAYKFMLISTISKMINNKIVFAMFLIIPLSIVVILELIGISKENKRKRIENEMKLQLEEFRSISDDSELSKTIEDTINAQIREIQEAKRDFKKIDELEETIQIPFEEIQKQIRELNKKLAKEEIKKDIVEDDTMILFSEDDIKEVIKKELEHSEKMNDIKKSKKKSIK